MRGVGYVTFVFNVAYFHPTSPSHEGEYVTLSTNVTREVEYVTLSTNVTREVDTRDVALT